MIRRRLWISLVGIVAIAVGLTVANLALRNEPALGLDLGGGISVVLAAEEGATKADLDSIRDLIRDELEGRGIDEPDVRVEGENVVVDLPEVGDQRAALDAVDSAGIVHLRPVMSQCTPPVDETATESSAPASTDPETTGETATTTTPDASGTSAPAGLRRPAGADTSTPVASEPASTSEPSASSEPPESTTTSTEPPLGPVGPNPVTTYPETPYGPPPESTDQTITTLKTTDGWDCVVGPVEVGPSGQSGGQLFERGSASVQLSPTFGWVVVVNPTTEGRATFNQMASACFTRQQTCPTGQMAIVVDGVVQSAPVVDQATFPELITISGGFSESDARSLARVLDRGAFPVEVRTEAVQQVSATLGADSLRAIVIAAAVGVVLVLLGLWYVYRRLIVVMITGLAVWVLLIYSAAAIISETTNYALSLAGVTAIVVASGITVDSYVVYFERLKEEVRHGRTIRNSAPRSFKAAWRTIIAGAVLALLAASLLFGLSIGPVRGFALSLGVTTICHVIVCWFFTRPAVVLLADSRWLDDGDTFGLEGYEALPTEGAAR